MDATLWLLPSLSSVWSAMLRKDPEPLGIHICKGNKTHYTDLEPSFSVVK